MRLTSIKQLCLEQGEPYHEICYYVGANLLRKFLDKVELWNVRTPHIYCGRLSDVTVFGSGYVYSKPDSYVFHFQTYFNDHKREFDKQAETFIETWNQDPAPRFEDECIYLGGISDNIDIQNPSPKPVRANFGHFNFEYLSRLAIFDLAGLDKKLPIVIHEDFPDSFIGFLELAGISRDRLVRLPMSRPVSFRKVWVSSCCFYRDNSNVFCLWPTGVYWPRLKILGAVGGVQAAKRNRLYIGRGNAKWRKIVNEPEVISRLANYGFEFPDIDSMSPKEQIETVNGAELIICAIGAASIITQFAPENCVIIVVGPHKIGTGLWGGLGAAMILGQVHDRLDCKWVKTEGDPVIKNDFGLDETVDYRIDMEALEGKLQMALGRIAKYRKQDVTQVMEYFADETAKS